MQEATGGEKGIGGDALLQRLIDAVTDRAVCLVDDRGVLLSWNTGAGLLTGYGADEMLGRDIDTLFNAVDAGKAGGLLEAAAGQDSFRHEGWCIRKDGGGFWSATVLERIAGSGGFSVVIEDLTRQRQQEDALRFSEARFSAVMDNSPVGLALIAPDGKWLQANRAISELLGYSPDELAGMTFQEITYPDDLEIDLQLVGDVLAGRRASYRMEKRYVRKDGSLVWGLLAVSLMRDAGGAPTYFIAQIQDMTDVREIQRELEHKALHDPLTGLANRRKFQIALSDTLEAARRTGAEHCLCFIDLDGFKDVNDTAGHTVGDLFLTSISKELEKSVRGGDLVARLGGDEFGVILADCPVATGQAILKRLCGNIAAMRFAWEGESYRVTASIGIAPITAETGSTAEVLRRADMACYDAKRGGRNAVKVHGARSSAGPVRIVAA